jgi:molybdenum cofactor cytidylyltransferase
VIGAIVLAAGASSRMGRPKATLTVGPDGRTFVGAIVETLVAVDITAVRVVVSPELDGLTPEGVANPDPSAGMLSSVQCGLRAFRQPIDAVLVWPVDHPLVRRRTVAAMTAAFRDGDPPIVVPTFEGRRGHPVLFSARLIPELLAADPSRGAREVVHAHGDRLELPVDDRGVIEDIDTPDDYLRLFGVRPPSAPDAS